MIRFALGAGAWMVASFALLWWVQMSVDRMHRHSAEAIGRVIQFDAPGPQFSGEDDDAAAMAEVVRRRQATPRDLAQVEFDRRELMRRLRILWITLTVVPVLAGAWWAARSTRVPPDTIPPHG